MLVIEWVMLVGFGNRMKKIRGKKMGFSQEAGEEMGILNGFITINFFFFTIIIIKLKSQKLYTTQF